MRLEDLSIPKPCEQSWESMLGDDRQRFCGHCQTHVHDLSKLSSKEVKALLASRDAEGHPPCVQMMRRRDGSLVTADRPWRDRLPRWAAAIFLFVLGGLNANAGQTEEKPVRLLGELDTQSDKPTPIRGQTKAPTPAPVPPPKPPTTRGRVKVTPPAPAPKK